MLLLLKKKDIIVKDQVKMKHNKDNTTLEQLQMVLDFNKRIHYKQPVIIEKVL
jgi:hypothetical protein